MDGKKDGLIKTLPIHWPAENNNRFANGSFRPILAACPKHNARSHLAHAIRTNLYRRGESSRRISVQCRRALRSCCGSCMRPRRLRFADCNGLVLAAQQAATEVSASYVYRPSWIDPALGRSARFGRRPRRELANDALLPSGDRYVRRHCFTAHRDLYAVGGNKGGARTECAALSDLRTVDG